jgi:hypothetical protein
VLHTITPPAPMALWLVLSIRLMTTGHLFWMRRALGRWMLGTRDASENIAALTDALLILGCTRIKVWRLP